MIKKILAGLLSIVVLAVGAQPVQAKVDYTVSSLDPYLESWKDMDDMELCQMLESAKHDADLYRFWVKLTPEEHQMIIARGDNVAAYMWRWEEYGRYKCLDWDGWDEWFQLKDQPVTVQCKKLSGNTIRVPYGSSVMVKASAAKGKITYTSKNSKVFTVSPKGKITTKGYGKSTLLIKASQKGKYRPGFKKLTVIVEPKKEAVTSLKSRGKNQLTVKWKKDSKATGYQIQFSSNSKFKGAKTRTVNNNRTTSKTITGLKAGKQYYVRVRAYQKFSRKTTIYGAWSNKKTVVVRKK